MNVASFSFEEKLWVYGGSASWHFVTIPSDMSDAISSLSDNRKAFRSVRVSVCAGRHGENITAKWETSVFFDSRSRQYLLPVKKSVRLKIDAYAGDVLRIELSLV